MGKLVKNSESGFSTIEALLVLIVVAIIGGTGWYVYSASKKTEAAYDSASSTSDSATNKSDAYAGWETYTANLQPVSFKYPANWTVATGAEAPVKDADSESISLHAPVRKIDGKDHKFFFTFQVHTIQGPAENGTKVSSSKKLAGAKYPQPLYAIFVTAGGSASTPHANDVYAVTASTTDFKSGDYTANKDSIPTSKQGQTIDLGGEYSYTENGQSYRAYLAPSKFSSQLEVKQAEQIFSSLTQK